MDVQLRVPIGEAVEDVREQADIHLVEGTTSWKDTLPAVMQDRRTVLVRAFRAAIRREGGDPRALVKMGTSDMNIYAQEWGCPMVTYGSGNSELDHTPVERISLDEFDRAINVLEQVSLSVRERL